jgi:serine phosphatase RsbU (regulator of sigma subunit)
MSDTKPSNVPERPGAGPQILRDGKPRRSVDPAVEPLNVLKSKCLMPRHKRNGGLRSCGSNSPSRNDPTQSYAGSTSTILGTLTPHLSPESLCIATTIVAGGVARKRRSNQMAIAREVQRKLLPQHMPELATLDYAGSCEPAWIVGGDYYDFLDQGNGRVGFVLADVSGKGVSAALLMANLQASVRSQYVPGLEDLGALFRSVNKLFYESVMSGFFATLFFAEYFDATRGLRYINCGHCPAFLLHSDGHIEKLHATATVLGMFEIWDCTIGEAAISRGDILVVYSDGVTEARNGSGEFFGEERLLAAVRANVSLPATRLANAISAAVHGFGGKEQDDDVTLLVARAC